jgi:hypothetical protein
MNGYHAWVYVLTAAVWPTPGRSAYIYPKRCLFCRFPYFWYSFLFYPFTTSHNILLFRQWCVVIPHQVLQPGQSPLFGCPHLFFQLSNIPSLSQRWSLHPRRGLFVNNISCALINRSSIPGSDRDFCLRQASALALGPTQLSTEGIVAGSWMWTPQFHLLPRLRIRLSCFHLVN